MKTLSTIFGALLFVAALAAGVYVGFWIMFIGGAVDIIDAIKAPVTEASAIGWGVLKMIFASFVGTVTFIACSLLAGVFFIAGSK